MIKIDIQAKYYDVKYVLKDYFNLNDYIEIEDIYVNKVHIDGNVIQFNDTSLFIAMTGINYIKTSGIVGISDIKCLYIQTKDKTYTFIFK